MSEKIKVNYADITAQRKTSDEEKVRLKNEARARRLAKRVIRAAGVGKTDIKARTGVVFSEATNSVYNQPEVESFTNDLLAEEGLRVDLYDVYHGSMDYQTRAKIITSSTDDSKDNIIPISKSK